MAMYRCYECEQFIDDDCHPMHIVDDQEICPRCYEENCDLERMGCNSELDSLVFIG